MDYSTVRKIFFACFKIDTAIDEQVPVLTVANDNSRSLFHKGKYYSPLIDTLEDDLAAEGVDCISVARIISTIKGDLSYGKVYSPEGGFARALVQKRLLGIFSRNGYAYSRMEESVWGRILDATKARKVVGIQPSRELCVACHKRGVWVADLQHGVIADMHPWYGESFRSGEPIEYLPSAFLCWDYGSARVIKKWAHGMGIGTKVIGHPWLARFAKQSREDRLVDELSESYHREAAGSGKERTILVSLSWGEADIPNGFIAEGLLQAIRKSAHVYRWLIRLHPNQLRGFAKHEAARFTEFFRKNLSGCAEWESATFAPLPVILKNADLHISWSSSVCIEASQMGIKSALLNPKLRLEGSPAGEYFGYHQERGMVELIPETDAEILTWIERNIGSKQAPGNFEDFDAAYRELIEFLSK